MASRRLASAVVATVVSVVVSLTASVSGMTANAAAVTAPTLRRTAALSGSLPGGDLLISNYSFEDGLTGWNASCPAAATTTTTEHTLGAAALMLTAGGACAAPVVRSALVTTTPGVRHAGFVQVMARSGSATVALAFYNSAKQIVGRTPAVTVTSRTWKTVKPNGPAPATARYVSVEITARSGGTVFADNVLVTRQFTDLGPRLSHDGYVRTATFGTDKSGRAMAYVVTDGGHGAPAHLNVIDVAAGTLIRSLPLNTSAPSGAWTATVGITGTVYVAAFSPGILWAYHPGASTVIRVATVRSIQVPFALAPDSTGGVYFGGYPDGIVYHYAAGKAITKFVSAKALTGQNYVRSLAVDPTTRTLYVGVGARAAVLACDEASARCTNVLPGAMRNQQFGYQLAAAPGMVFAYLSPSNTLVALKTTKHADRSYGVQLAATIPGVSYPGASSPIGGVVYYRDAKGALAGYDLATGTSTTLAPKFSSGRGWGSGTLPGQTGVNVFAAATVSGGVDISVFNVATRTVTTKHVTGLPGAPVGIESLGVGPDGDVYTGGYLVGGLAGYSPMRSDQSVAVPGVGQPEGMAALGDTLYLGVYPKAVIQAYRPSAPVASTTNPKTVCSLAAQGQDRPYAVASGGGKVFIGTGAGYGLLQGALTIYDPATGACDVHKNLAPNQSVVSLAYSKGVVYGGTLAWGGLGAQPKAARARLISYNVATGTATSVYVPVVASSLEGLTVAPNGNIWMLAQNWLLIYSPTAKKFVSKTQLFKDLSYPRLPLNSTTRVSAYDGALAIGADGKMYGTLHGRYFFRLDSHATPPVVLYRGAVTGLTTDGFGNLYFARSGDRLVRYVP